VRAAPSVKKKKAHQRRSFLKRDTSTNVNGKRGGGKKKKGKVELTTVCGKKKFTNYLEKKDSRGPRGGKGGSRAR